jgi:hypothetical protein
MLSAQMANQSSFQDLIPLLSLTIVFWFVYRSSNRNHFEDVLIPKSKIVSAPTYLKPNVANVVNDGFAEYPF